MSRTPRRGALLISLAAILPLGACVSQSDYDDLQGRYNALAAQNEQLQASNRQLQGRSQQVQGQNQQLQGDVARLQGAVKYTVNSDLLFAPGSWEMAPAGRDVIAKLASQLAPSQQRRLVVNGYTDNTPIGVGLQNAGVTSNEILSQRRAEAVRDYLISRGFRPELLAAKGWGEDQPVAPNDSPAGRAQNRRVEITLASGG